MSRNALASFLAAVRRRLWLDCALRRAQPAALAASGTLLILALANIAWRPVPAFAIVIAAACAAAIVFLPVLWSRPTTAQAALHADRYFGACSLMTTALEMHRLAPERRPPAAQRVLRESGERSAKWRPRLGELWSVPPPTLIVLAVIPAFVAVLLLAVSTSDDGRAPRSASSPPPAGRNDALNRSADVMAVGKAVDELRASLRQASPPDARGAQDTASGHAGLRRAESVDDANDDAQGVANGGGPASGSRTSADAGSFDSGELARMTGSGGGSGDGVAAGDGRAANRERRALEPSPAFHGVIATRIPRRGDGVAASNESLVPFADETPAGKGPPNAVRPAAAPPVVDGWTSMTAAEVAYARRYLDAANNARD